MFIQDPDAVKQVLFHGYFIFPPMRVCFDVPVAYPTLNIYSPQGNWGDGSVFIFQVELSIGICKCFPYSGFYSIVDSWQIVLIQNSSNLLPAILVSTLVGFPVKAIFSWSQPQFGILEKSLRYLRAGYDWNRTYSWNPKGRVDIPCPSVLCLGNRC